MRYEVGCTITVERTGLSCDLKIGHTRVDKDVSEQTWRKVRGYLDLRDESGYWMYTHPDNGIVLVAIADPDNPYWSNPGNWLVRLYSLPNDFVENLRCGENYLGEGLLMFTKEKIRFRVWFVGAVQ